MTNLIALAERVEAATGPDRELDADIYFALFCSRTPEGYRWLGRNVPADRFPWLHPDGTPTNADMVAAPCVTSSLDAAMTLVPERCLAGFKALWDGESKQAYRGSVDRYEWRDGLFWKEHFLTLAATPALALTAACLRARAAQAPRMTVHSENGGIEG